MRRPHLPHRLREERGFTLIELLVVLLIVGILAAIAIPAFLSQTSKASDSAAKTQVGTLQTTIDVFADEHAGSFAEATLAELKKIEPTLNDTTTAVAGLAAASAEGFEVTSEAVGSKNKYKLANNKGVITRTCVTAGKGGCNTGGTW